MQEGGGEFTDYISCIVLPAVLVEGAIAEILGGCCLSFSVLLVYIYIYILRSFYIDINEEQNAAKNISSQLQGK